MLANNVEHCTPTIEQLEPFQRITCSQPECGNIFSNQSNYQMHLEKHHRLNAMKAGALDSPKAPSTMRLFYCPVGSSCAYWYGKEKGKNFKSMKLLRQHYQKVHMAKRYECDECSKAFGTETQLKKHKTDVCGRTFTCKECGWSYDSMEALWTHGKRKGHSVKDVLTLRKTKAKVATEIVKKARVEKQTCAEIKEGKHEMSVQTVDFTHNEVPSVSSPRPSACSTQMSAGVQTDLFPEMQVSATNNDLSNALEEIHSLLRDIETQTEPLLSSAGNDTHNYLDQMLAQSHMYTQTCDDFLSELGLADIQTQTHWPSPQREEEKLQFTSTATSTNACIHDELLVSTETQTSFTQCLLNSCTDTGTGTPPVGSLYVGGLYHTQHTQTCDEPLLESFDFGGQASDLMDGFQSTYTQT